MNDNTSTTYRARTVPEHERAWKLPVIAWSFGLPSFLIQHLAECYRKTPVSGALRILEPLGIMISVLALLGTIAALWITLEEISEERTARNEERQMRRATLLSLAYERLEVARQKDFDLNVHEKHTRAGQIAILEEMVRQRMRLTSIDASFANLSSNVNQLRPLGDSAGPGILLYGGLLNMADFRSSNLAGADFRWAELDFARFQNAFLRGGDFRHSTLRYADFSNADMTSSDFLAADMTGTKLNGTNLSSASLLYVEGLSMFELNKACTNDGTPPQHLPSYENAKERSVWWGRRCDPGYPH